MVRPAMVQNHRLPTLTTESATMRYKIWITRADGRRTYHGTYHSIERLTLALRWCQLADGDTVEIHIVQVA